MKKKIFSLLVLLVAAVSGAWADEVMIGDEAATTNTYVTPYNSLWGFSYVQQVYTANEIGMAGTIRSIAFCLFSEDDQTNEYDIYMKHVTREAYESDTDYEPVTADNMVYSGSITFSPGWTTITLDTPFEYDGTNNLMIALHEKTPGYSTRYFYCTEKTNSVKSFHSDSYDPDPYNLGSYSGSSYRSPKRANIKLIISGSAFDLTEGENEHGTVTFKVGENTVTSAKEGDQVTVTVTPDTGYAVDEVTGKWYAAVANSRRIPAGGSPEIDLLSDIALTAGDVDETTGAATYTFTMERANAELSVTYKHRHIWDYSVDGDTLIATCQNQSGNCDVVTTKTGIALPEEIIYGNNNAAAIDLTTFNEALGGEGEAELVSVSYKGTLLNGGAAYGPTATVPTLPGDYTVTITVKAGDNNYVVSNDFTLEQKTMVGEMIVPIDNCVYNGQFQEPTVVVKDGDKVLTIGTDYLLGFDDNVNAGLGIVMVHGVGNYTGTAYATFNILDKELTADMIQPIADQSYTGSAIEPTVVVKDGDTVLKEGRDYSVTYENNVEAGTATVVVTAMTHGNYSGEIKATFNIVGTTGISAANSQQPTANRYYDLGGRQAKATKKGVVIVDGKKILKR